MPPFSLIIMVVLVVMAMLTLFSVRYLLSRRLGWLRLALVLLDAVAISAILYFGFGNGTVRVPIILFFMAQLILSVLVLLAVFVRFLWRRMMRVPFDGGRRRVLVKAGVYPAAAVGLSLYGWGYERLHTVERRFEIPVAGLPGGEAVTIAQISDIHLGAFFSLPMLENLLAKAAESQPDLLVVTGDLFDDEALNEQAAAILGSHVGDYPLGIVFIMGNHEYYRHPAKTLAALAKTDVCVLRNASVRLPDGLYIAGADYPQDRPHFDAQRRAFAEVAVKDVPQGAVCVFLGHHPEYIDDGAELGAVLTLTGHTHGSQFGILGEPVFPVFKYTRGLVRVGESTGYVHCGNGSWFPMRIGCPPEIAYFTLTPKEERA